MIIQPRRKIGDLKILSFAEILSKIFRTKSQAATFSLHFGLYVNCTAGSEIGRCGRGWQSTARVLLEFELRLCPGPDRLTLVNTKA